MEDERRHSSLDDDDPGSQGEITAGSEGDFGGSDEPLGGTEGGIGTGDALDTGLDEEPEED